MAAVDVIRTKTELRTRLSSERSAGRTIGLVPTMGFLHAGHVSLLEAARRECDVVVMSLFVNPAQFGAGEDLESYPRDEQRDVDLAEQAGTDIVFAPEVSEVYPPGFATEVRVTGVTQVLCGDPSRRGPGHFDGVTTVVAKLLGMGGADVAYFGQKDAQQAIVVKKMVTDLDMPVRISAQPTVREDDGVALSSRNTYLNEDERSQAPAIHRALETIRTQAVRSSLAAAIDLGRKELEGIDVEYLEARDAETLDAVSELGNDPVLVAVAARIGKARLIDNTVITPPEHREDT